MRCASGAEDVAAYGSPYTLRLYRKCCWQVVETANDSNSGCRGSRHLVAGGRALSVEPHAGEARVGRTNGVGVESVAHVGGVARGDAKSLTRKLEDTRVRFGYANVTARFSKVRISKYEFTYTYFYST